VPAMSRFALVTPSFNQGAYLRACVDSVLAQKGVELDYAVADGGSEIAERKLDLGGVRSGGG